MKKDFTIVSSFVGAGLEKEAYILRDVLVSHGHYVNTLHYTHINAPMSPCHVSIFMEVVLPPALSMSRENWLIPNSEWWSPANDRFLPQFTKIICKTKDCYDIWCKKVGSQKCFYTSFESRDLYNPDIQREMKCLHVAGKSEHKNTDAVLRAYRQTRLPHIAPLPHLTVISRSPQFADHFKEENPFPDNNVTHYSRVEDDKIAEWMNSHIIHVMPSMYEGFGHCIWEGLSCGALMITTDASPMNSYEGVMKDCLVKVSSQMPRSLAQLNIITPEYLNLSIRKAVSMYWNQPEEVAAKSSWAQTSFHVNRTFFRTKFMELVNSIQ